ncbi:MAG: diguanylate cyclase [Alphaproteobacteria bacterium]
MIARAASERALEFLASDAALLLRYVGWTEQDAANVETLRRAIEARADTIVDRFYDHLDCYPELAGYIGDGARRDRLRATQRAYLASFGRGIGGAEYVADRLAIGHAHERVGLAPRWYIGAYAVLGPLIADAVAAAYGLDGATYRSCVATATKIIHVDSVLAIEAYHGAALARQDSLVRDLELARRRLEDLVRHDALTGVAARREAAALLDAECERSRRFRRSFSVLFVDIDRFKAINDRHGHAAGDAVLGHVARTLAEALRPADIIGRWGGEEFVIGLVECPGAEAEAIAERLRAAVEASPLVVEGESVAITVSIGLTSGAVACETARDLIARADRAMYLAKRAGRNRVRADLTQVKDAPKSLFVS